MRDPDSHNLISQDTFSELMAQLNDATENGNFTRLNDNIQLDFGDDEVKTTFQIEKFIISGTGRSTVYTTMVRQKKLAEVDGLAFTIVIGPTPIAWQKGVGDAGL
ncbi:unnamed protein product [Owenia fusiformis]|uniref:Uncharacterized protein n=1 Tax=Owenia fusiformis TaxID=6347 RepID=A0A8S4Q2G8_OWEFU|nr:unnamed protein product [Owenia fusiformis]